MAAAAAPIVIGCRGLAYEQLVQDDTDGIDVRSFGQRRTRDELFGSHVPKRPNDGVRSGVVTMHGNPEVRDPDRAVLVEKDVRRFEIPVQNAVRVRSGQALKDLLTNVADLFGRKSSDPTEQRSKVFARHKLHRVERLLSGLTDVEHPAHGRIGNLPGHPYFVHDAGARLRSRGDDHFQRHGRSQHQIVDSPHFAHSSASQPRDDAVAPGKHVARDEARCL